MDFPLLPEKDSAGLVQKKQKCKVAKRPESK